MFPTPTIVVASTPRIIRAFGAPVTISLPAVLFPLTNLRDQYEDILFCVINLDPTNSVTMTVNTSEDGAHLDVSAQTVTIGSLQQGSIEVDAPMIRTFWSLSAQPVKAKVPISIKWQISGVPRVIY